MRNIHKLIAFGLPIAALAAYGIFNNPVSADDGDTAQDEYNNDTFPRGLKYLVPPPVPVFSDPDRDIANEHVAYGAVDPNEILEQPIAYSHMLHAGELQIECQYCHTYAKRSIHAGIPSTQICMNCHGLSPNGQLKVDPTGRPELYKLLSYNYGADEAAELVSKAKGQDLTAEILEAAVDADGNKIEQQPIPWQKVHDLPDFVHFTHKRHVKAGLECQECHGEVQDTMTVAYRVSELTMGWCLNCHESHPSVQENHCDAEALAGDATTCEEAELRRAEIKDCYTCHK